MPRESERLDRKRRGVCTNCASRAPLPNRTTCSVCNDTQKRWYLANRERVLVRVNADVHKRYTYRRDNRLCTSCGIALTEEEGVRCRAHEMRQQDSKHHRHFPGDRYARTPGNPVDILEHWKKTPRVFLKRGGTIPGRRVDHATNYEISANELQSFPRLLHPLGQQVSSSKRVGKPDRHDG